MVVISQAMPFSMDGQAAPYDGLWGSNAVPFARLVFGPNG